MEHNLADMGTKALNGPTLSRLYHNQVFPPPKDEREYQAGIRDTIQVTCPERDSRVTNHVFMRDNELTLEDHSPAFDDLIGSLQEREFRTR